MKRIWLAGGLFAAVILLCVSTLRYQQRQIKSLLHDLDAIEAAFDTGENAHTLALQFIDRYDRNTRLFPCFMSHSDLVGCRESIVLLPSILEDGNPEEFRMESARCRAQLEKLISIEMPSWQNIL